MKNSNTHNELIKHNISNLYENITIDNKEKFECKKKLYSTIFMKVNFSIYTE